VVPEVGYGAALLYFTGSKAHNVELRKRAVKRKMKLNEYGLFKKDDRVAGKTEKAIYKKIGLPFIAPELRENRGEIGAAEKDKLPDLVSLDDIRGDFHVHTNETDGRYPLKDMVEAAQEKGYEYLGISDHSKRVSVANGMDEKRLRKQMEAIDELNSNLKKIRVLKSIEVDILKDGSLDLPDDVLKELDLVIASVHYYLDLSKKKQTDRILRALDNPHLTILGHPTGRKIGEREPYDLDMEKIMKRAKKRACFMEINAQPDRLDLSDIYANMAIDMGIKLAISTDAHTPSDLDNVKYGIGQARRGWCEKRDILNTYSWKELKKMFKRS
jgi:DNA polymerase (family 10)